MLLNLHRRARAGDPRSYMKTLVLIKSAWKYRDRRDAQRETWLPALTWADHFFVVGRHAQINRKPFAPKDHLSNMTDEPDLLILDVADDFRNIGPKVRAACQWAITREFDTLVVVDDDTYLRPERLHQFVEENADADYIGFSRFDFHTDRPTYQQGNCFVLSREAARIAATAPEMNGFPDDPSLGKALDDKVIWRNTARFYPGPNPEVWPEQGNNLIATHKCLPEMMHHIHRKYMASHDPRVQGAQTTWQQTAQYSGFPTFR